MGYFDYVSQSVFIYLTRNAPSPLPAVLPKLSSNDSTKCTEIFAQGIPSAILQTFALLHGQITWSALFSILVSAAAVSFSSVSISIEYDVEPKKREFNGSFYGFYPKNNRLLVFLFMLGFTMAHVLMKVLACALVLDLSGDWVAFYMAGDVSLYLLYKIIRHDFIYWVPMESLPLKSSSFHNRENNDQGGNRFHSHRPISS